MKPQRLTEQERFNRLRLARTDSVGPANYRRLLHRFGSAEEALARLPDLSKRGGRSKPLSPPPMKDIEAEFEAAAKLGARYLFLGELGYPVPLAATEDAPMALIFLGNEALLHAQTVAIVGARNASANGIRLA